MFNLKRVKHEYYGLYQGGRSTGYASKLDARLVLSRGTCTEKSTIIVILIILNLELKAHLSLVHASFHDRKSLLNADDQM